MKTCPVCDSDFPDHSSFCPTDGAVLIASQALAPGSLVRGKYRIVRKIGQGGMGVVYLAEHILLGGQVALKFLSGELAKDPHFIKRFRLEARAAYQLRHANIVEVTDLDQAEDGSLFIAMEFVEGPSLRSIVEQARSGLAIGRALQIARGIASGLAVAHAKGTVHRDIKPENVLLARTSDNHELPKVLDFGIVAMTESVTRASLTRGLLLTPEYAAPEQWVEMPASEMDGRTDLYALGGVLYEMLTGRTPYQATNTSGWMRQHLDQKPAPPSQWRPELNTWPHLDSVVLRMLYRERDGRPAKAEEVINQIDALRYVPVDPRQQASPQDKNWQTHTVVENFQQRTEPVIVVHPQRPQPVAPQSVPQQQIPQQFVQQQPVARQQPQAPAPPVVHQQANAAHKKLPAWAWGAGAFLAIIAIIAIWRIVVWQQNEHAAEIARQAIDLYNRKLYTEAVPDLDQACSANNWEACKDLGNLYSAGNGVDKNPSRAFDLYKKSCDAGYAMSCSNLGLMYDNGEGAGKDYSRAMALYSQACDAGIAVACSNLGTMYEGGRGTSKDYSRAQTLYSSACDQAVAVACRNLGVMYNNGEGISKDLTKAAELFQKSCDAGDAVGCTDIADMYRDGDGVTKDDSRAIDLYNKSCNGEDAQGCTDLGWMYENGRGVTKDDSQAAALYARACNGGDPHGCTNSGFMYENGNGVTLDVAQAVSLYSKACDAGDARGCSDLGILYENGKGVDKDTARAKQLYQKGCSAGDTLGCTRYLLI